MPYRSIATFVLLVALVAVAGCADDAPEDPLVLQAGQLDIRLPDGWKVTERGAQRPSSGTSTDEADGEDAPDAGSASSDTVPLAKQDPTTAFFQATQSFRNCLKDLGTAFIGAPDGSNPDSPTNDPEYIKDLSTCAAKSGIVQALQEMQKAQDEMTPAEIEKQNKQYLRWRTCMIGKGWKIGEPTPDEKGRLFSFSASEPPDITPPPGKDLLGDEDMQTCAEAAQG